MRLRFEPADVGHVATTLPQSEYVCVQDANIPVDAAFVFGSRNSDSHACVKLSAFSCLDGQLGRPLRAFSDCGSLSSKNLHVVYNHG